jgi:hypothetical protein
MPDLSSIYSTRPSSTDASIAEPTPEHPYRDIFSAAAQNELVAGTDNLVAEPAAREQAYDARIKSIKDQAGIELENPERGGYSIEARRAIRQAVIAGGMSPIDETGGIPAYQKRIFDQKLAEIQQKHPDLNLPTETAESIAHASGDTLSRAMDQPDLNPVLKYGTELAGSLYGERRNPLFLGSLFAGPTSAVGEAALAKVATSALFQGLYNVGVAQAGKVATQQWQAQIGRDEGRILSPAEVGAAFLMGAIPGAAIEGGKQLAEPLGRLLRGRPEPGDMATASEALGPVQPQAAAAMRAGEESLAADKATLTEGAPKDVAPELHDDLIGAALKRADDPAAPSPEAVAAIDRPAPGELQDRIEQAAPQTPDDAMRAADEALDDFGRRDGMAALREGLEADRQAMVDMAAAREQAEPIKRSPKDPFNKIPWLDSSGRQKLIAARTAKQIGDDDTHRAMIVRSCKDA